MTTPASPLALARRFVVPRERVLDPTVHALRAAGLRGQEAFVVWTGVVEDDTTVRFTRCVVPEQTPHTTPDGLLVTVGAGPLNAINRECHRLGELMAGQVHTHPTDAYHSQTDDHFPLVTLLGALSVVIPDFASRGSRGMDRWAFYRLTGHARWKELTRDDKVEIVP
jgi:hypothetical protein